MPTVFVRLGRMSLQRQPATWHHDIKVQYRFSDVDLENSVGHADKVLQAVDAALRKVFEDAVKPGVAVMWAPSKPETVTVGFGETS